MSDYATVAGFVISREDIDRIAKYGSLRERVISLGLDSPGIEDLALVRMTQLLRHCGLLPAAKTASALLLGAFLALGASGCTRAPRDLVTVAQYPDGSFSVDVYDAEGELATTLHLPSDARMADAFSATKGGSR